MAEPGIVQRVDDGRTLVRLRVALPQADAAARRLELPPAGAWSGADPQALWAAPDQWLLVSRQQSPDALIAHCAGALAGVLHHAVDESDALHCLALEGAGARTLLAMGSGVDFDPERFKAGRCARTRLAKVAVLVAALEGERFELYADRSIGAYLLDWFHQAGRDPLVAGGIRS
jgi:heterotetrameric sarcosine oxidase gamma subunit